MRSSSIRFTGMASGMDTDSIVRDMLRPQQYKIDNQKKAQALLKLKQDAWKDMNKKLYDFHTKFTHKLSMGSTFNTGIVTSSNENAIGIIPGNSVPSGTHRFTVEQLATSTTATGKIVGDKTATMGEILDGEETIWKEVKNDAGEVIKRTTKIEMMVNGETVSFDVEAGDTLAGVAAKMNTELQKDNTGFKATYDEARGMFFINSAKSGEDQTISFNQGAGNQLFVKLGFIKDGAPIDGAVQNGAVQNGVDAIYRYNGHKFESDTNNIEINGIKVTLKSKTVEEVIISSEPDVDATYNFVKEFVTEYNKLITEINEKLGAKPGKDIAPLTAEEREGMTESEIKLWEEKLNDSLFYRDEHLEKFATTARSILGGVFDDGADGYKNLSQLGIVTGNWREGGTLHILGDEDEDDPLYSGGTNKLKAAISENPDAVIRLLNGIGDKLYKAHGKTLETSDISSALNFYNDKVMTKKMEEQSKQILTLEERLYKMEQMHYAKFAAMEKMLSALNSQSSWLSQQFGG